MSRLRKLDLKSDNLLIGIEATGIWWENIYSFLSQNGFKIIVLNPHQTNKYREALRKKAKTDAIDAYLIAGLLRSNDFAPSFIPQESIQILREITKLKYQLLKNLKSYQRQAMSLLGLLFPEYSQTALKNPFAIASLAIFKKYPTAKHLANAKPKHIEKIVRSIKGNNFYIKNIQLLLHIAKSSTFSGRAKDDRGLNLNILLAQVESLNNALSDLDHNAIIKFLNVPLNT